jgi:hypothetical protein
MISLQNRVTVNSVVNPNLAAPSFSNLYSVLLDGISKHSSLSAVSTALASNSIGTYDLWIKPIDATPTTTETIWSFGDTDANEYLFCNLLSTGSVRVELRQAGTRKFRVSTDAAAFSDGVWAHIAVTADGVNMPKIYINGVEVAHTDNITNDVTVWLSGLSGMDNLKLGASNFNSNGNTSFLNANMDEIKFTNRTLTQPQIADIYNGGTPKDESGLANLVSYFRIDGDTVPTMTDSLGSNSGTYVNCIQGDIKTDAP